MATEHSGSNSTEARMSVLEERFDELINLVHLMAKRDAENVLGTMNSIWEARIKQNHPFSSLSLKIMFDSLIYALLTSLSGSSSHIFLIKNWLASSKTTCIDSSTNMIRLLKTLYALLFKE
jgi:hypothetical protein